jgi:hypothetical protein
MIVLNSYLCSFHISLRAESDIFLDMHIKALMKIEYDRVGFCINWLFHVFVSEPLFWKHALKGLVV